MIVMARPTSAMLPSLQRQLTALGENIRLARLRRGVSMELLAARAGMSRTTLRAIENGSGSVTMAAYANVLNSLGLQEDISMVARDDELGRKLQDLGLERPSRKRAPKKRRAGPGSGGKDS